MCCYYYLDISLELKNNKDREITAAFFKKNIVTAVQQLFGETGASVDVDLLKYNPDEKRAILRVPNDHYVKLHSSLTLCSNYESDLCAYRIHKATPLLLSLLGDSRNYIH